MLNLKTLTAWADKFKQDRVQHNSLTSGDFLSSETSVIVSGPPTLDLGAVSELVPMGLIQNFSANQGKQIFTLNEVGSSKPFNIPGRTRVTASISRILFDGPSLMYVMSLYSKGKGGGDIGFHNIPAGIGGINGTATSDMPADPWDSASVGSNASLNGINSKPAQFFINLRSSFFNRPTGLGVIMYDNESQPYGGFYLEECYINGHNISLASQSVILMENASLIATNIVPIPTQSII